VKKKIIYLVGIKQNILDSILPQVFTETQFHDVRNAQMSTHVFLVL